MAFKRAERKAVPLKLAIMGPSGSGKTYSAIRLAHGLTGGDIDKILVVDTENESAALYSNLNGGFLHEVIRPPFMPRKYCDVIRLAVKEGIRVVILDSVTHAWEYILSYKEELDKKGGNSFTNWGKAKPLFRELKDGLLQSPVFVIACLRSKSEYAIEESESGGNRKASVKKLGTSAITEPGFEYEFSVVWSLDRDTNQASVEKDRTGLFQGKVFTITEDTGRTILEWLGIEADSQLEAGEEWTQIASGEREEFTRAQNEAEATKNGGSGEKKHSPGAIWLRDVVKATAEFMEDFKNACKAAHLVWQDEAGRLSTIFPEAPALPDILAAIGKPGLAKTEEPKQGAAPKGNGSVPAGAAWISSLYFTTIQLKAFKGKCEQLKLVWQEEAERVSKLFPEGSQPTYDMVMELVGEKQEAANA